PTLGEVDLHLIGEGRHEYMWRVMGAHVRSIDGIEGVSFAVWAPAAKSVRVVGDFNSWNAMTHPMRVLGTSGIWELFIPGLCAGSLYKFEISTAAGAVLVKADPFAFSTEAPSLTASRIADHDYAWGDADWMAARAQSQVLEAPVSIYECHIGSWRRRGESGDRPLTYRELAEELGDYLVDMGFTHVQFLPVAEHPFGGSWGYQVSAYYAPSARFGSPDDFRYLVDHLHQRGIGVLIDWVPAHFPKDDFALSRFDGTALFEHEDPRQGEHPDWGTLVFNFGRNEVRNFLLANAAFWCEEFHVDGLRVDAVASMLYLDYSRKKGEWIPNRFGGRENLDAVEFLRQMNTRLFARYPGITTIAEESTAWPAVSRPVYVGGLGFGFKWNMGWMHDTLQYFSKDPVHRRYHHNMLTFGLLYAWHENFVLPLSHDEVVHGKGSLLQKMPGDRWQKFANLRSLLAWMWAHPGKQLLFMGGEIAQEREWSHDASIDWHLLGDDLHAGVQGLVREMNAIYRSQPPLFEMDFDVAGFQWIDANDTEQNVFSFVRFAQDGRPFACVANLSPMPRRGYRVGLPSGGLWLEVLNSDDPKFGGSGVLNDRQMHATGIPWHGFDQSVDLDLPPLGVIWLSQQ
ncbi:MAG TPA: 1,4-alpha-glucan branching protein GlgB, partial [Actinomycetota bacterium]|nr:1,4-alpha-glucan branching protein GlgB [Actinomycetota bacterium]